MVCRDTVCVWCLLAETHITFKYHRCVSARPDLQVGSWLWQFSLSIKPSKDNVYCSVDFFFRETFKIHPQLPYTQNCISIWCSAVWSKDGMKAGILYFGGALVVTAKPLHRPETPVVRQGLNETLVKCFTVRVICSCTSNSFTFQLSSGQCAGQADIDIYMT